MTDSLIQLSPLSLALVPIVMGLVSISKGYMDARYSPLLALVLGIAGSFLIPEATWQMTTLAGLVIGLMAAGVYSGAKATFAPTPTT